MPQFAFEEDIVFIDAYAFTKEELSSVSIKKSVIEFDHFRIVPIHEAVVSLKNMDNGEEISLLEEDQGVYIPPVDFLAHTGETWKLLIDLPDGRHYESSPETVNSSVPIDNISAFYSDKVTYDVGFDKFVPGHKVRIGWTDPPGEQNFYMWKYRSFEPLITCLICEGGTKVNGECVNMGVNRYYTYSCETSCWMIRHGEEIQIFDDRFTDGKQITGHSVADIPYYRRQDILVEVQQFSLSQSAFEYFSIINDILEESSGLNAPPPAALLGNLYNPDNPDEPVLGQFIATSVNTETIFIDRSNLPATPIQPDPFPRLETCPFIFCEPEFYLFPCVESYNRTGTKPKGWPG